MELEEETGIFGGGYDKPDDRDWKTSEIEEMGGLSEMPLPSEFRHSRSPVFDQRVDPSTYYACSIYGLIHAQNEEDAIEAHLAGMDASIIDPYQYTQKVIAADVGFRPDWGWHMQGAMKFAIADGIIAGYSTLLSVEETKRALVRKQLVYTGSNQIDYQKTKTNGNVAVFTDQAYGHIFCVEGYDDSTGLLTIRNSYGTGLYDNGRFYVRYQDFGRLFGKYAIWDDDNMLQAIKAKQVGIWNGERPSDMATRKELATMLHRVSGCKTIWNGTRPDSLPTRNESSLMTRRAVRVPAYMPTRKEVAEFCLKFYKGIIHNQ